MRVFALFAVVCAALLFHPSPPVQAQGSMHACKVGFQRYAKSNAVKVMRMSVKPRETCIYSIGTANGLTIQKARIFRKPKSGRIVRLKRNHFVYRAPARGTDQFAVIFDAKKRGRAGQAALVFNVSVR